jgi:hypothetical protein
MISRLWPVLPLLFAISERLPSKKKESAPVVGLSDIGTMLQGCVLLSAQSISNLVSPR